jgi:hypothetical protein
MSFSSSNESSDSCEVCPDTTSQHPGLASLIAPLLVSRQFHAEALPILFEHLALTLGNPLEAAMLLNQSQWGFSTLRERVRWVEVLWHLDPPDVQAQREGMRGLVDGLRRAREVMDEKGSGPLKSLRGLYVEMHMDAPGSYGEFPCFLAAWRRTQEATLHLCRGTKVATCWRHVLARHVQDGSFSRCAHCVSTDIDYFPAIQWCLSAV